MVNWYVVFACIFTFLGFCSAGGSGIAHMVAKLEAVTPMEKRANEIFDNVCFLSAIVFHITALAFAFKS